jgi:nitrate reductase delta subunit
MFQAAALVLSYPDEGLLGRLDLIESAVSGSAQTSGHFAPVIAHLRGRSILDAQAWHVREFDLSRRHALHLTYWSAGDTRRRGADLIEFTSAYRASGLVVDTGGELPDYLPMVLEFAVADRVRGFALLSRFRAGLDLLRQGLIKDDLPHAGVLTAVCAALPKESQ